MSERPILFSAPMVRALLDGRKTQTRRIVKPQPPEWVMVWNGCDGADYFFFDRDEDDEDGRHWPSYEKGLRCPYGVPGDRLWVRETWQQGSFVTTDGEMVDGRIRYAATDTKLRDVSWRTSIHMPRWASRITLEITDVRAHRLQEISDADAAAEGVDYMDGALDENLICRHANALGMTATDDVPWFAATWDHINGTGSWDANPWVWAISFCSLENPNAGLGEPLGEAATTL